VKFILELAIVLLGASVSATTIAALGPMLIVGIACIVAVAICASYVLCRALALPRRMAILIACGNSICGNSAIAAVAPVIGADGDDIASSISFTAVLGVVVVLGLPFLVPVLHLSLTQYGLGRGLGLRVRIFPRWGELDLQTEDTDARLSAQIAADPGGVDMDRVASTMRAVGDLESGRLSADAASKAIAAIAKAPPAPTWLFALAAAAGAVALSVIFGVEHFLPMVLIFVSAGAGAILRRAAARISANLFIQPLCAALLAGVIGAIAVRYDLSSSLRLIAVCPCMVLVPGPHFLT
jgi:Conserved hypothetical protein 698/Putative threonine/serine exporter